MRPEKKVKFTNSEHGLLARLWHTFLKDRKMTEHLPAKIARVQTRQGISTLSEKARKKLATIRTIAYEPEISFKNFIYLFKELIRGSSITFNMELKVSETEVLKSTYKIMLQSIDEKQGGIELAKLWNKFVEVNGLFPKLKTYIENVRKRDMTGLSTEQQNKLKTIGKYVYPKDSDQMTFKTLLFLMKELLLGEQLTLQIVLKDAIGEEHVSTIVAQLNTVNLSKGDENES